MINILDANLLRCFFMISRILQAIWRRVSVKRYQEADASDLIQRGAICMHSGDLRGAVDFFKQALEKDPYNVGVLNDLGACLSDMGDTSGARSAFDLAYSLDDTHGATLVNRAKMLIEAGHAEDALSMMTRVKAAAPHMIEVNSVYGAYCMARGEVDLATMFHKRAWLMNFGKMRYANSYLFHRSYSSQPEWELAAEHRFWADTMRSPEVRVQRRTGAPQGDGRIRIGYWSPDLRGHSVRYFFRPLLAHHDKEKFEVHVYHDGPKTDEQTAAIKADAEFFYDTFNLTDQELCDLFASHQLDVLVELAGHSSHNRISLLKERFADVQITALGYPPTTGLSSVDAKIIDRHILTDDVAKFYTEEPVALSTSFWCFDPMEPVPPVSPSPCIDRGSIVFGCVGNISKITEDAVCAWGRILEKVPRSKLLVRSINFRDASVREFFLSKLIASGIDEDRLDLRLPAGGGEYYASYSEIDVILDTYPFNGGTTTCFAAYMGVPVVTMSGASLVSRMGRSVLSNLDLQELVAESFDEYVDIAVNLAADHNRLNMIRMGMRDRFVRSPLGNGAAYAREFEHACRNLLEARRTGQTHRHEVPLLPERELLRRAYQVMAGGQSESLDRIVAYLQINFPESGAVKTLAAQHLALTNVDDALEMLLSSAEEMSGNDLVEALIISAGWCLLRDREVDAATHLRRLESLPICNEFDRLQVRLLMSSVDVCLSRATEVKLQLRGIGTILAVMICQSEEDYHECVEKFLSVCTVPDGVTLSFVHLKQEQREAGYLDLAARKDVDFIFLMHEHVCIHREDFIARVLLALERCDVVSFAGAKRWERLDWTTDHFAVKAGGWLVPAVAGEVEIKFFGLDSGALVEGMTVLDGSFLALKPRSLESLKACSEDLFLAGTLLEQHLSHVMHRDGCRLGVARDLCVSIGAQRVADQHALTDSRLTVADTLAINLFPAEPDDTSAVVVVVRKPQTVTAVVDSFLGDEN